MKQWYIETKKADFNAWAKKYKISPIIARLLRNRELQEEEINGYLAGTMENIPSVYLLKDMQKTVSLLSDKIEQKKFIRIIGDYDADGICATFILAKGLEALGACVDAVIPHRVKDGYGINHELIEEAVADGVDAIITCDNGISAIPQVDRAKELGITMIITDHHEPLFEIREEENIERLPKADAIVNCKQEQCKYPYKEICGALTAYKVIQALYEDKGENDTVLFAQLVQAAAIATVCDIMDLKEENRIIVKEGLKQMRVNPLVGIDALCQVNNIAISSIATYHLGFMIGPSLNASGRLDSAYRGFSLLKEENLKEALMEAEELKKLNDERKRLTSEGVEKAIELIESTELINDKVLVVYLSGIHESIAGIIAGRIKEKYYKPVFLVTDAQEGIKGSGRSIDNYNMHTALVECEDILSKFGGHAMAVGFSLAKENLDKFRKKLNENCKLVKSDYIEKMWIDIDLPFAYATVELANEIQLLEPFGKGNRKPLFAQKDVHIVGIKTIGKEGRFLKVVAIDSTGYKVELVFFGDKHNFLQFLENEFGKEEVDKIFAMQGEMKIKCAYEITSQWFNHREKVQFKLVDYA